MENQKSWGAHIEFAVLLITLLGGFYMINAKCERAHDRIDKQYEIWVETQKEIKQIYIDRYQGDA